MNPHKNVWAEVQNLQFNPACTEDYEDAPPAATQPGLGDSVLLKMAGSCSMGGPKNMDQIEDAIQNFAALPALPGLHQDQSSSGTRTNPPSQAWEIVFY